MVMGGATYKIVPGGGVGGQAVVEFYEYGRSYRLDKRNLSIAIENIKRNRGHYHTEEAYQKNLAVRQAAWNALMEWEAEQ